MGNLFKNRIDLNYVAENGRAGEYERHRAIKILRPTTDLSGLYKCKVSSVVDEDFLTARMTVFGEDNVCKLKFKLRELISCFCCVHTSHMALEADSQGSSGTLTGNEVSQLKF